MSVKGIRKKDIVDEPVLLGNITDIIEDARKKGYCKDDQTDIEKIITDQGIIIQLELLPASVSGYIKKIDKGWIIGVNATHHKRRQRFTMAHEFAHYCLHKNESEGFEDTTFFRKENDNSIEYNANEYASELLMPKDRFLSLVKEGKNSVIELRDIFDVSALAIKYRAKSLGISLISNE